MIEQIISQAKAHGVTVDGDMFFALVFRTKSELIVIGSNMGVELK